MEKQSKKKGTKAKPTRTMQKKLKARAQYIASPNALHRLNDRLHATWEELAAWVFMGPKVGGLTAYIHVNELDPPPRFHFDHFMSEDYIAPLMACRFKKDDIERFKPAERFITGKALVERWSKMPGIPRPEAFIRAEIADSRLVEIHPIYGCTQATFPQYASVPPLTSGLFMMSLVEKVEADFPYDDIRIESPASGQTVDKLVQEKVKQQMSLNAKNAAIKRNAENEAMRIEAIEHYMAHENTYRSVEAAARAIAGTIVPVVPRTVANWIREFKKQPSARTLYTLQGQR